VDFSLIKKRAEDGDLQAQHDLGMIYLEGKNQIEIDAKYALDWLKKAANQGNIESQFEVGYLYRYGGNNVTIEIPKSLYWLEKAANSNHANAQFHLGNLYMDDVSQTIIPQSPKEAQKWYERAAMQKHKRAMFQLAMLYLMIGADEKKEKAEDLLLELINDSQEPNPNAMMELGLLYYERKRSKEESLNGLALIQKSESILGDNINPFQYFLIGKALYPGGNPVEDENIIDEIKASIKYLDKAFRYGISDARDLLEHAKKHLDTEEKCLSNYMDLTERKKTALLTDEVLYLVLSSGFREIAERSKCKGKYKNAGKLADECEKIYQNCINREKRKKERQSLFMRSFAFILSMVGWFAYEYIVTNMASLDQNTILTFQVLGYIYACSFLIVFFTSRNKNIPKIVFFTICILLDILFIFAIGNTENIEKIPDGQVTAMIGMVIIMVSNFISCCISFRYKRNQ
jgi:TPR repeat protein